MKNQGLLGMNHLQDIHPQPGMEDKGLQHVLEYTGRKERRDKPARLDKIGGVFVIRGQRVGQRLALMDDKGLTHDLCADKTRCEPLGKGISHQYAKLLPTRHTPAFSTHLFTSGFPATVRHLPTNWQRLFPVKRGGIMPPAPREDELVSQRLNELFAQWKQAVTQDRLPVVVAVHGDSDTLVKRAVEILLDHLFAGGGKALNYQTFDGRSTRPAQWVVATRTSPMMARRRVVHVTDADGVLGGDGAAMADNDLAGLLDLVATGNAKGLLLLTARTINSKSKLATALREADGLHGFETFEKQHDVNQFIRSLFRRRNIQIEERAVSYLADALGRSAEAIIAEVDKLSEYAGQGRQIALHDAQEMVQRLQGHEIFELNRALVQKDAVKSLTLLDRMYRNLLSSKRKVAASGLPLLVLSTCIEGEFRKLAVAKKYEQDNDVKGLAAALKLRQNVAGIVMANARRFTAAEIEATLGHIHRVDFRLKSTSLPSKLLLEELILSICARRA